MSLVCCLHWCGHLVDPVTASRLAPHDAQRISRALEVWRATGLPLSQYHQQPTLGNAADTYPPLCLISLEPRNRAWLHQRIEQRFEQMLEQFIDGMDIENKKETQEYCSNLYKRCN